MEYSPAGADFALETPLRPRVSLLEPPRRLPQPGGAGGAQDRRLFA